MAQGDTRCIDGTLFRHCPQWDDPEFEIAVGRCPECNGAGCVPCDECGAEGPWPVQTMESGKRQLCPYCYDVLFYEEDDANSQFCVGA